MTELTQDLRDRLHSISMNMSTAHNRWSSALNDPLIESGLVALDPFTKRCHITEAGRRWLARHGFVADQIRVLEEEARNHEAIAALARNLDPDCSDWCQMGEQEALRMAGRAREMAEKVRIWSRADGGDLNRGEG